MTDPIERQDAIDALARTAREKFNLSDEYSHYLAGLMDGELAIKNLPSVEPKAVPVIRCKDCKFLRLTGTVWKCQNRLVMMLCDSNDYCSRAERKEE